jgi:hypothetical protein
MQSLCKTPAVPLFDREQHRSSVPTKFRSAVARSGGQGRPRGRRAPARLALDGRKHGGILIGLRKSLQPSAE